MKLLSLNSWQKTNGLFCVHMRRARDHRDDGETMGQRPGVTRCQWYIFVWISALRNPNGGHTLGKCAQIVIQWYFEGCIRNNMSQGPPNKHLCFMLSRYFKTFKHSALIWRIWIDQVWVKVWPGFWCLLPCSGPHSALASTDRQLPGPAHQGLSCRD